MIMVKLVSILGSISTTYIMNQALPLISLFEFLKSKLFSGINGYYFSYKSREMYDKWYEHTIFY